MHDVVGSAGMLRGWAAIWTMQLVWLLATMAATIGVMAIVEMVFYPDAPGGRDEVPSLMPTPAIGGPDHAGK